MMKVLAALFALLFATSASAAVYRASFEGVVDEVVGQSLAGQLGKSFSIEVYYESEVGPDVPGCADSYHCSYSDAILLYTARIGDLLFEANFGLVTQFDNLAASTLFPSYTGGSDIFSVSAYLGSAPSGGRFAVSDFPDGLLPFETRATLQSRGSDGLGLFKHDQLQTEALSLAYSSRMTMFFGYPGSDEFGNPTILLTRDTPSITASGISFHEIVAVDHVPGFNEHGLNELDEVELVNLRNVPLPASGLFLIGGLGLLGLRVRRRL